MEHDKVRVNYKKEFVNIKDQQKTNLSAPQKRGLAYIWKRVKNGEIVVVMTDKSGKVAIMSMNDYMEAALVHCKKDEEVGSEFVEHNQKILNGHTSMWLKMFNVGSDWSH